MKTYTFSSNSGNQVQVEAADEAGARDKAIRQLWGPPTGIYGNEYKGRGLDLKSIS